MRKIEKSTARKIIDYIEEKHKMDNADRETIRKEIVPKREQTNQSPDTISVQHNLSLFFSNVYERYNTLISG